MKYLELVKTIDTASRQLLGHAAATVNQALVLRNWMVGSYLIEYEQEGRDRAKYGARLLEALALDLGQRGIKGLSDPRVLRDCRGFYRLYPQIRGSLTREFGGGLDGLREIRQTVPVDFGRPGISAPASKSSTSTPAPIRGSANRESPEPLAAHLILQISWTKVQELIRLDDPWKRAFYENECLKGQWSVRQLQRQIGSLLYERTGLSKNKEDVVRRAHRQEPRETIQDLLRDPYVLEFTGLAERPAYSESDLESALLDHLQAFLLELGAGFCFEARQKRITVGNKHDYIDLVFYHRRLRCHVLLDLKVRSFRHTDAGQMNFYINWWKANAVEPGDNPPVGILLCSDRDRTEVEFATAGLANKLFVSRYLTALPSAEQLQRFVEADRARIEALTDGRPSKPSSTPKKPAARPARKK